MSQLSLFRFEPAAPPLELVTPDAPPVVLAGQLGLFDGPSAEQGRIARMLSEARFQDALRVTSNVARSFEEAAVWRVPLALLHDEVEATRGRPEALAALAGAWGDPARRSALPRPIASGILRGLYRACAQASEARELGAVIAGRPAGWYWLQAGCLDEAKASLEASEARGELPALTLVLQANLALQRRDLRAGVLYRAAFVRDHANVPLSEIADSAVRELVDEARGLGLRPPEAWVPLVGELRGTLPAASEPSRHEDVARFQALLQRSREATSRGTPDVSVRRELKALAPELFELLRDEGRL